jgi:nucleoid-associated protein YgaU
MSEKLIIRSIETSDKIECMFNPEEYTLTKSNDWQFQPQRGEDVPKLDFKGGKSQTLTLNLFFDTSLEGYDVRRETNKLVQLMEVTKGHTDYAGKSRPPLVVCQWGKIHLFKAVIQQITQQFKFFRDDGTPVRAVVTATFSQAEEENFYRPQNPTTSGQYGHKRWTVKEGDTIDLIAFHEYNDSAMWRYLANINGLSNPSKLKPGQILVIAPAP